LIDRLVVMLIPLFAVLYPVAKFAPSLYGWRVRSRIFKRYGELKFLEADVQADETGQQREEFLKRLDAIERAVSRLPAPLAFSDMLYTLRGHIEIVRAAILRRSKAAETPTA
ncbi:MAG TPA: C4-dicarboxylate ABC transporter substrate-binding protein, partial [Rhodocyclaceae bacterium]|nr:C4-dicarboxylate ABC transporter substrate-binding protein [Rhodocyclaceae bacterium]